MQDIHLHVQRSVPLDLPSTIARLRYRVGEEWKEVMEPDLSGAVAALKRRSSGVRLDEPRTNYSYTRLRNAMPREGGTVTLVGVAGKVRKELIILSAESNIREEIFTKPLPIEGGSTYLHRWLVKAMIAAGCPKAEIHVQGRTAEARVRPEVLLPRFSGIRSA